MFCFSIIAVCIRNIAIPINSDIMNCRLYFRTAVSIVIPHIEMQLVELGIAAIVVNCIMCFRNADTICIT